MKNKITMKRINAIKNWFFENGNRIEKASTRLTEREGGREGG